MSLQVWLPLNGNLNNQGLANINLTNAVTFAIPGKIGQSCLNSQLGWFAVPEMAGKKQMSFAYWVKLNAGTSTNWLDPFSWYSTNGTSDYRCRQEFYYYNSNGNTEAMTTGVWYYNTSNSGVTQRNIGQWYHYAFTIDYETGITQFFVDGTLWKTTTNADKSHYIKGNNFLLRESTLDCSINDFRLYDHCLSQKEVEEISKGLILHYKLDDQFVESTTNLITTEDGLSNTCYNGAVSKYNYGTNTDMYKTTGVFQGKYCTKVYMGTAGKDAYPYVYFDPFNTTGENIQTLSFDYFPTTQATLIPYSYNGTYNFSYTTDTSSGSETNINQIVIPVKTNQWNHITITAQKYDTTNTSRGNGYIRIGSAKHTSTTTDYWLFANIQVENKDHATGYAGVGGTRTSSIIYDSSGYENYGILIGSPILSNNTIRYKNSLLFDGIDDAIQFPYNQINPSGIFTVNLWFYKSELGSKNYETLFGGPSGFEMDTRSGSSTTLSLYMASVRGGNVFSPFTLNTWYMITMVRDGINELYYVNGNLVKTIEAKSMPTGTYYIGAWNVSTSQNYKGNISDFRLYATVLTEEQIKELYNTSATIDNNGNIYARDFIENDNLNITKTGLFQTSTIEDDNNGQASIFKTKKILGTNLYEY